MPNIAVMNLEIGRGIIYPVSSGKIGWKRKRKRCKIGGMLLLFAPRKVYEELYTEKQTIRS